MNRKQKLIIAILGVILIWLLIVIGTFFIGGPDLAAENKTILVTGHTGFKGSWLTRVLLTLGSRVVGYSLTPPTDPNLFTIAKLENNSIGPKLIVWATPITDIICSLVAVILFCGYVKHNGKNAPSFNEQEKLPSLRG